MSYFWRCWLTAAGVTLLLAAPTNAGESSVVQGVMAGVETQVSWGSAGGCNQNIETNNFGALTPDAGEFQLGSFDATPHTWASVGPYGEHVWVGCVTTNAELGSVTVSGLHDMRSAADTLSLSDVYMGLTNTAGGELNGGQAGCVVQAGQQSRGSCALAVGSKQQTLVSQANAGTTELNWQYQLDLAADQPVGRYTGGEVIFTASAGGSQTGGSSSGPPSGSGSETPNGESPCSENWTGSAGDGSWENAGNWQSASTPGAADHVCIPANTRVTVSGKDDQAGWITDEGILELARRSLLSVNGPSVSTLNRLTVDGGTLTGAGTLDVAESLSWPEGTMEGSGQTVLEPQSSGAVAQGDRNVSLYARELVNEGVVTIDGQLYGSGVVRNTGTLQKTEGSEIAILGCAIENEGSVSVSTGELEFQGGGNSGEHARGSWSATGAGSQIVLNSRGDTFALGAKVSISGSMEVEDGTVTAGSIEGGNASLTVTGRGNSGTGMLEVYGPVPSTVGGLTLTDEEDRGGGILTGSGEIDVTGSFSGGGYAMMEGDGPTVIEPGAIGSVPSPMNLQGHTLENRGILTLHEGGNIQGGNHSQLVNSGTLIINSQNESGLSGEGTLINTGSLERTEGAGSAQIRFAIDNEALIKVEAGELEFQGGGESGELTTDTWSSAPGASIALNGFNSATYDLGATATIVGGVSMEASVSAGTIEGAGADLTSELGNFKLTGLTPSSVHSLKLAEPTVHTGHNEQRVSVASELDIKSSLTWSSNTAELEGQGKIVLEPGSTNTFNPSSWVQLHGGELMNEGTLTWESGGMDASGENGTFFLNSGTLHINQNATNPVFYGCRRESSEIVHCPVLENTGLITATFPISHPHIEWRVDIANYGKLEVPYEQEPECKWEFSETPGPGGEACYRAIREYEGLLLQDGAEVFEGGFCPQHATEPCIDLEKEPGEEEELASEAESGGSLVDNSECNLGNHCYAKIESPLVKAPSGFEGAASQIDPQCMTTNGDSNNFNNDEQWVVFSAGNVLDWTEAGAKVGLDYYYHTWPSPEYFTADNRVDSGNGYSEHNSGHGVAMNQYFQDTIWHLGGGVWEAFTPGIHSISSPQGPVAYLLQVGTENTSNNVATKEHVRKIEYETLHGGWRSGWTPQESPVVTRPSPGYANLASLTTAELSFNSC